MANGKDPKQPGKPRGSYHKKWGRNAKKSGQCQIYGGKKGTKDNKKAFYWPVIKVVLH